MTPRLDKVFVILYSMGMFVREVQKPNDHVSIRIVENKRIGKKVRQSTLVCLGHTHKNNTEKIALLKRLALKYIRDLKSEGQYLLKGMKDSYPPKKAVIDDRVHISGLEEKARVHVGCSEIFGSLYDQLKLAKCFKTGYKKKELNDLLKEMVLARIEAPLSKRKSVSRIQRHKGRKIDEDRVYRMMDKLSGNELAFKDRICHKTVSLFKEKVDVVFFDVTTLYFESFVSDELKRPGFSKDNKVKEVQVVLALMTTERGLPVGYELFSGNTFEGSTLIQTMDKLSQFYSLRDVYLVADRGMFSKKNIQELDSRGVRFIVGARLKSLKKDLKEEILAKAPKYLVKKSLRSRSMWFGEFELNKHRLIVNYSYKRALKDQKDREKTLESLRKKLKDDKLNVKDLMKNRGHNRYLKLKGKKQEVCLDEEKIRQATLWDGFSAVITNEETKNKESVLEKYKGLWQIEAAFRLNKHDLQMRPIYHWTARRIEAHVLICFIAYSLVCFAQETLRNSGLKLSFEQMREELKEVQATRIWDFKSGLKFLLPSAITDTQKQIYKAFKKTLHRTAQQI